MKIGFIIYGSLDTVSGGYLYDRLLVEQLRAHGDTVEIISLPWRNYASHLTDNLHFRLPRGLDILIQDELNHPSLIRANQGPHPYPVISLVHHLRCSEQRPEWQNRFYRMIEKIYLKSVDGFIFNSHTTRSVVHGLAGDSKPHIVGYPPTDRFGHPISEEEVRTRSEGREFRILFLGNVTQRKGLHTLLEAMKRLNTESRLDIIGSLTSEPRYARSMQAMVDGLGLNERICFHGPLERENLRTMLKRSHVLVVPSSYEGFGIVYLEGMGFGLPAIGTTAGAAGEVITDQEDGFVIDPDDSESLAFRLDQLARNRDMLLSMSFKALHRYKIQPKWEMIAAKIRDFLLGMTQRK